MTQLLAHRGASAEAPENTLAAFRLARKYGAAGFECDVQRCKSGELVLFHDQNLLRTTNFDAACQQGSRYTGGEKVKDLTLEDLQTLDAGSWKAKAYQGEKIPLLEDLIAFSKEQEFLVIEIKYKEKKPDGTEAELLRLLKRHALARRSVVGSFNRQFLIRFRSLNQKESPNEIFPIALISQAKFLHRLYRKLILPQLKPELLMLEDYPGVEKEILRAHEKNQKVFLWTLDELGQIRAGLSKGADGIISNCAQLFSSI